MKNRYFFVVLFLLFSFQKTDSLSLKSDEAQEIGKKIWHNECKGTVEGLTSWNTGEGFASLGIGHFIWYPNEKYKEPSSPFQETFPSLLLYLKEHKKKLPSWLEKHTYCPWQNSQAFHAAKNSKRMQELRTLLLETIDLQTQFIIDTLANAVSKFEKHLSANKYAHIKKQFNRIAKSPNGLYALIDYANFKGIGLNAKETYKNQGWGLIQVLEKVQGTKVGKQALEEFAKAAKQTLTLRVNNSPKERNEARWLKGWFNRIDTYTQ